MNKLDVSMNIPILRSFELDLHKHRLDSIQKRKLKIPKSNNMTNVPKKNFISYSKLYSLLKIDEKYRIMEGNTSIMKNIINISNRRYKVNTLLIVSL